MARHPQVSWVCVVAAGCVCVACFSDPTAVDSTDDPDTGETVAADDGSTSTSTSTSTDGGPASASASTSASTSGSGSASSASASSASASEGMTSEPPTSEGSSGDESSTTGEPENPLGLAEVLPDRGNNGVANTVVPTGGGFTDDVEVKFGSVDAVIRAIAVADFDGDDLPDIAVLLGRSPSTLELVILRNTSAD